VVDQKGEIVEKEVTKILGMLKNQFGREPVKIPSEFNPVLQKVKDRFIKEVVDRYVELKHGGTITAERRYVIGELKKIYDETESEDTKSQVELFEKIYRNITRPAVLSELRKLKRNHVEGRALLDRLTEIWYRQRRKSFHLFLRLFAGNCCEGCCNNRTNRNC